MNYDFIRHHKFRFGIAARYEGKLKFYESCLDVRTWSHDPGIRDRYLRDWMKYNMPICIVPVCTLASILSVMACRSRGRVSRCPSGCKSKVLLDNISTSCNVMRDCLKDNKEFEKYFREEDYETFHWPCERCLDILKNIKMFWKIVVEKVLKVQTPKSDTEFNSVHTDIRNVVRGWKKDIIREAKYVKSSTAMKENNSDLKIDQMDYKKRGDVSYSEYNYQNKSVETECGVRSIASQKNGKSIREKISKCISASFKMVDSIVDACHEKADDELLVCKSHMEDLQTQFETQKNEIERLEKENILLNIELQCIRENNLNKSLPSQELSLIRSIENNSDEKFEIDSAKDIESEMIITIKNCANETFRQISMLQVLHKSNGGIFDINESKTCCKNQDPVHLLNKVYKTFGAIVRREITIAKNNKESTTNDIEIKTTYRDIGLSKPAPSCSTTSLFITSDSNFESAKDT